MKKFCIKLIESYQNKTEYKAHRCRFYPSCSNYALEAYKRYNFFKASFLAFFRIIRCNPLSKGGYNPVPEKKSKLIEIKKNVYILEHKKNTDRPNIGYILQDNIGYMIDAGNSKKHVKLFMKSLKKHKLPYPKYTIITHHHWDHTFGLYYLNNISIGLKSTNEILLKQKQTLETDGIETLFSSKQIPLFCKDHLFLEYKHKKNKIRISSINKIIENNYSFDDIILFKMPTKHTEDSLIVLDKKNKVLFLGDSLCEEIIDYDFIYDGDILKKQYDFLSKLDFEIAIESHSNPYLKEELLKKIKTTI